MQTEAARAGVSPSYATESEYFRRGTNVKLTFIRTLLSI